MDRVPQVPQEILVASAGAILEFDFGGTEPLASMFAMATPAEIWWQPGQSRTTELRVTQEKPVQIFAELPPGDYVLNVYYTAISEETGYESTAPYYFRILLK